MKNNSDKKTGLTVAFVTAVILAAGASLTVPLHARINVQQKDVLESQTASSSDTKKERRSVPKTDYMKDHISLNIDTEENVDQTDLASSEKSANAGTTASSSTKSAGRNADSTAPAPSKKAESKKSKVTSTDAEATDAEATDTTTAYVTKTDAEASSGREKASQVEDAQADDSHTARVHAGGTKQEEYPELEDTNLPVSTQLVYSPDGLGARWITYYYNGEISDNFGNTYRTTNPGKLESSDGYVWSIHKKDQHMVWGIYPLIMDTEQAQSFHDVIFVDEKGNLIDTFGLPYIPEHVSVPVEECSVPADYIPVEEFTSEGEETSMDSPNPVDELPKVKELSSEENVDKKEDSEREKEIDTAGKTEMTQEASADESSETVREASSDKSSETVQEASSDKSSETVQEASADESSKTAQEKNADESPEMAQEVNAGESSETV